MNLKHIASAFVAGLIFALGLGISGMTDANKVIGFLNLAGTWDPSLAFVMLGAIGIHLSVYRFILQRQSPLFASRFHIPTQHTITPSLVMGSALFGIGWGLGGFCPGPGWVSLAQLQPSPTIFVAAMLVGMAAQKIIHPNTSPPGTSSLETQEKPLC